MQNVERTEDDGRWFHLTLSRDNQEAYLACGTTNNPDTRRCSALHQRPLYQRERARLAERARLEVSGKGHDGHRAALRSSSVLLHYRVYGDHVPARDHGIYGAHSDRRWLAPGRAWPICTMTSA